jgi:hypothetical protein
MKISTLVFSFFMLACTAHAQFVLVNSPGSIAGSYNYGTASFGAAVNSGTWTADCVFVDNGTATPTLGCGSVVNGAEVAGKIAFVDRGTCSFYEKAANAEAAGAIAVVIFNHTAGAGPMGMSATAGFTVTVPVVSLSYEDGQTIRAELANGPVNMTIGNVVFPNNIGTNRANVMNAPLGVMPIEQAEAILFSVTPAAVVLNLGTDDATNITVDAKIEYSPLGGSTATEVYNESGTIALVATGDTSDILGFPEYVPVEGAGVYNIKYSVEAENPDNPLVQSDNEYNSQFVLSENIYCKGGWDLIENKQRTTIYRRPTSSTKYEFLAGFDMPVGVGYRLDSISFEIATNADSLAILEPGKVNAYVYEWIDVNNDSTAQTEELVILGYAPVDSFDNPSSRFGFVKVPILEYVDFEEGYIVTEDNIKLFVGVRYEGDEEVFFGFDEDYDQTIYFNTLAQTDIDLPYVGVTSWDGSNKPDISNGFIFSSNGVFILGAISTSLFVSKVESPSVEKAPIAASIEVFPNPTANFLNVETELLNNTKTVEYTIRDVTGRMVFSTEKVINGLYDKAQFNVSQLSAGQYFLTLKTEEGGASRPFTVKR